MDKSNLQEQSDLGFSLLETMIALAILSMTSLALFQSTSTLLRVSDKATEVGLERAEDFMARTSFYQVVAGLVQGWPHQENTMFRGDKSQFSGLSDQAILSNQALQSFEMSILPIDNLGSTNLLLQTEQGQVLIKSFDVSDMEFRYLGIDQTWYEAWPPPKVPSTGFFNDIIFMSMPDLPSAIKIVQTGSQRDVKPNHVSWISSVATTREKPHRRDDVSAF